ncbi:MAG: D-aminoacyl-tRNA deacylase [Thermoplasmata archaeon]
MTESRAEYLIVLAESDPVATAVGEVWGVPSATGDFVEGTAIRRLSERSLLLRRPGPHVLDERLDAKLPERLRAARVPLVFPSIHRSGSGTPCFTVHPLGNPTASAELGGRPARLTPSEPRRMASALRALAERGTALGLDTTLEATHHGPLLDHPAFFVEIGFGDDVRPPPDAVVSLAMVLPELEPDPDDRIAVAIGGGHYAPHFTDLVLKRRWAIGHILSRHAIEAATHEVARAAWEGTPGAVGWLCARAADYAAGPWAEFGGRAREADAPRRGRAVIPGIDPNPSARGAGRSSGT